MCGILAMIGKRDVELVRGMSAKLSHRGPDERDFVQTPHGVLCHERLSIVDLHTGKQPIKGKEGAYLVHNGEIYNHEALRLDLKEEHIRRTKSDSEIILHLYEEMGEMAITKLDGVFAFVILDGDKVFAGRDPLGVKPLFYGYDVEGALWFASETKALIDVCTEIKEFPIGHYYTKEAGFVPYFKEDWFMGMPATKGPEKIRGALTKAVQKRFMSDAPLGVLLSGGLDSSLTASIAAREMKKQGKTLKSFSVGISKDSSDLEKARKVAEFLGTEHHEVIFTPEEGAKLLEELIYKLESYDVTSIRASTPMYIMSKYIRDQGVKVVLSGEGADEIFGGYLYFGHAPSAEEFHYECLRRLQRLYTSDIQRADRSTMGSGVEARVPFLDLDFLKVAMELDPQHKVIVPGERMEKTVLREAFDCPEDPYLPDEVLWRQKEQFSDGVGYSWVDTLKEIAESQISDEEFAKRGELFPHNTPFTKEALFYRKIFAKHFPHPSSEKMVKKWIPRWQDYDLDPSGRANAAHTSSYHEESESAVVQDEEFAKEVELEARAEVAC